MAFVKAYILPNHDPAIVIGPVQNGYVYEHDAAGNLTAIVITGNIVDDNWQRIATYRIEGDELASLPVSTAEPDPPDSPRFQAIMSLVAKFVRKRWTELDAQWQAERRPVIVTRNPAEVAALPDMTPDLLNQLAPAT